MADVTKVYGGAIIALYSSQSGDASDKVDLGLTGDGNFTLKAEPVKRKNSAHEEIVVGYDVKFEVQLLEVKNLSSITPLNNQVRTLFLDEGRGSDNIFTKIMPLRLNVEAEVDFGDTSKSGVKITATKRIRPSDIDTVIVFDYDASGQQ